MKQILKFYTDFCYTCKDLTNFLELPENKALLKDVEIISVDMIDHENEALATKYKVNNPPCLVFLKDGIQVSKVNGFKAIAKTELLEHHLNKMK